jgi:hypothetical protein
MPASARSMISSRSNSARAARIPKTSLLLAWGRVDRSALADQHPEADAARGYIVHGVDQFA